MLEMTGWSHGGRPTAPFAPLLPLTSSDAQGLRDVAPASTQGLHPMHKPRGGNRHGPIQQGRDRRAPVDRHHQSSRGLQRAAPDGEPELSDAFDEFAANPDLWVTIITGAGDKAFCAGNDLKYHAALRAKTGSRPQTPPKGFGGLASRHDLDKPVIAAVNGVAMGGGFEIALAADILIASDQARFALPEPRVGLAAGGGGMQRLSRQIPLKRAMGMMLTGRHVSAREGYELGFVTAVVPHAQLMAEARSWAGQFSSARP
jgi:1,4-dihydroxy-2-naphthoyl-CoA synthase